MLTEFDKDPNATLDYTIDWSDWLATGDTISTSTWTVPAGITASSDTETTTTSTVWLTGGTSGRTYLVTNTIVTAGGRTEERSLRIRVNQSEIYTKDIVSLEQVKLDLRVTHDDDDRILQIYLDASLDEVKRFLNRDELPTLPVDYPYWDSDMPMDSEDVPSPDDPIVPSIYSAVFLLVRAKYDATDPDEIAGLRKAAENILMPYRTEWGV